MTTVIGSERTRRPVAWKMAFAIAAFLRTMPIPETVRAKGARSVVGLVDKDDVDRLDVGIHRYMVLREIMIHEATTPVVHERLLGERRSNGHDDVAVDLAARRLRIQDSSRPRLCQRLEGELGLSRRTHEVRQRDELRRIVSASSSD